MTESLVESKEILPLPICTTENNVFGRQTGFGSEVVNEDSSRPITSLDAGSK